MLENRSQRTGVVAVQPPVAFLRAVGIVLLFGTALSSAAHAQKAGRPAKPLPGQMPKSGAQAKPLPKKSQTVAFYTPEGQQQIADAILTETLDQLWSQSDDHFDHGEYNHSINLCRVIVQGNPRHVEAFAGAAFLLWSTGQNENAIAFLKQGLRANPDSYYMYDELGSFFYVRLKDYPSAITYYEQAIKFDSPFFTWSGLAHCYEKTNQWDKAVKTWEKANNFVSDRATMSTMKRNLARAKAELEKHQKE